MTDVLSEVLKQAKIEFCASSTYLEYKALEQAVNNLRRAQIRLANGESAHCSRAYRHKQIGDMIDAEPNITNAAIADRVGITSARVSQIRKDMGRPAKRGRPEGEKSHVGS